MRLDFERIFCKPRYNSAFFKSKGKQGVDDFPEGKCPPLLMILYGSQVSRALASSKPLNPEIVVAGFGLR